MTNNEKIAAVIGVGGVAYFLFGSGTAAATPLAKPAATSPSTLASILKALGSAGSAFGIGAPGGAGPSTGGSSSSGLPAAAPIGPSWDLFNDNTDNGLNQDGTIASGPLSFSDGTTVDLNLIDPDTGMQVFQVPTQDSDPSGFIQDAIDNPPADDSASVDDGTDETFSDPTPIDETDYTDWSSGGDGGDGF